MTKNLFKNAKYLLYLRILLYFLYIFDSDFRIFYTKEHLSIYTNPVFYKEDKIYLIDTNHIYDDTNPRILIVSLIFKILCRIRRKTFN